MDFLLQDHQELHDFGHGHFRPGIGRSHKEVKSAADEGTLLYFNTPVFGCPPVSLFLFSFFPLTSWVPSQKGSAECWLCKGEEKTANFWQKNLSALLIKSKEMIESHSSLIAKTNTRETEEAALKNDGYGKGKYIQRKCLSSKLLTFKIKRTHYGCYISTNIKSYPRTIVHFIERRDLRSTVSILSWATVGSVVNFSFFKWKVSELVWICQAWISPT